MNRIVCLVSLCANTRAASSITPTPLALSSAPGLLHTVS